MRVRFPAFPVRFAHVVVHVVGVAVFVFVFAGGIVPGVGDDAITASNAGAARGAVIGASPGEILPTDPAQSTYQVTGGGGGGGPANVTIVEDVALDFSAGPWLKDLVNATGSGFLSGQNRTISETLTNAGTLTWTGWHERVVTRTTVGGGQPDNSPGFLFRPNSLTLSANRGAGFVPLVENVDYTVAATSPPPGSGGGSEWETITITFTPQAVIEPGDILNIQKDIFEVFGDADIWMPGEAARIGEYPIGVPEPGGLATIAVAAVALVRRGRGRGTARARAKGAKGASRVD